MVPRYLCIYGSRDIYLPHHSTRRLSASPLTRQPPKFIQQFQAQSSSFLYTASIMADSPETELSPEEELRELFASANADIDTDIMAELQSIMRLHSIDPQELWYKWESYSMKMGTEELKLDMATARALKESVQDNLERENRSKAAHVLTSTKRAAGTPRNVTKTSNVDVFGMYGSRCIWIYSMLMSPGLII